MKAAAIISLIVGIILGVAALGNFMQDDARSERAIDSAVSAPLGSASGDVAAAENYERAEENDEVLGLIALVFLIAAFVLFSQIKRTL